MKDAVLFYLLSIDNAFLYLSCASYSRTLTDHEILRLQMVADNIRNSIK